MKKVFFILFTCLIGTQVLLAQANLLNAKVPQEVGIQNEQQVKADNNDPIEYGFVDDRDILWSKTVFEVIDLNERINFPYYYPTISNGYLSESRQSLYRVLIDNIESGDITEIYTNEYFDEKITFSDLKNILEASRLTEDGVEKSNAGEEVTLDDYNTKKIESGDVIQYRIKGTWYVNKRLGELKYRLLGIAPYGPEANGFLDLNGESASTLPLIPYFWIWFPDARGALNKSKVFNSRNSSQPITYDNMLNSRRFNSTIYKEENVYEDREIKDYIYDDALRQLLESNRIKAVIRNFEQDLWNN